jgi:PhzF family phenazine biosynthesis protein
MQRVAAENRHSETAFVVPRAAGDLDLRWFTPEVEDDLCGHATLASAYVLSLTGHKTWPVRFRTLSGVLTVNRRADHFEMDFPSMPAAPCEPPAKLLPARGFEKAQVMRSSRDFLVVVDREETVRNLKPDIDALSEIDMGIGGGAIVSAAANENEVDYVCRFFVPSIGIDEDPATGSIQCALAPYWAERTGKREFRVRQLSARGGQMRCTVAEDRVKIAGQARLYLQGTINI